MKGSIAKAAWLLVAVSLAACGGSKTGMATGDGGIGGGAAIGGSGGVSTGGSGGAAGGNAAGGAGGVSTGSGGGDGGVSAGSGGSGSGGGAGADGGGMIVPDAGTSDDGGADGAAAPVDHLADIRAVEAKCTALGAQGVAPLDYVRAVAAYMATLPDYVETGVDETTLSAYGVFQDGLVHVVSNNVTFDAKVPPPDGPPPQSLVAGTGAALPAAGTARLLQSFGPTCHTQAPLMDMAGWLASAGYGVFTGTPDLPMLRAVSGDSFFYFNTHGGRYGRGNSTEGLRRFYSLQSATIVSAGSEMLADVIADRGLGRLTYHTAPTCYTKMDPVTGQQVDVVETHYGVTAQFVSQYWHFDPNAIVFMHVCFSALSGSLEGPQDLISAVQANSAAVYMGWDGLATPNGFAAAEFFVDRLLGANQFMSESPRQRPFPWDLVYADMMNRGLTKDGTANLVALPAAAAGPVVLAPSIRDLIVNEEQGTLTLEGYFGATQGKATVGGQDLPISSWAADSIVGTLALSGPGSSGDVVVEVPGYGGMTRKSNVRQLSEWDIPLHHLWTSAFGAPGWQFEGSGTVRLRGDVGDYRDQPGTAPQHPVQSFFAGPDSSFSSTASGTTPTGDMCSEALSGSATFLATFAPAATTLRAMATIDMSTGGGELAVGLGALSPPFQWAFVGPKCPAGGPYGVADGFGLLETNLTLPSPLDDGTSLGPLPALYVTIDGQLALEARTYIDPSVNGDLGLDWPQVVPISPPDINAAR